MDRVERQAEQKQDKLESGGLKGQGEGRGAGAAQGGGGRVNGPSACGPRPALPAAAGPCGAGAARSRRHAELSVAKSNLIKEGIRMGHNALGSFFYSRGDLQVGCRGGGPGAAWEPTGWRVLRLAAWRLEPPPRGAAAMAALLPARAPPGRRRPAGAPTICHPDT